MVSQNMTSGRMILGQIAKAQRNKIARGQGIPVGTPLDQYVDDHFIPSNWSKPVNKKQWLPVYGLVQAVMDYKQGKPSLADPNDPDKMLVGQAYHTLVSGIPILIGAIAAIQYFSDKL